jgi:hypothetical protein
VSGLYCLRIYGEWLIGDQINNGDDVAIELISDRIDGKNLFKTRRQSTTFLHVGECKGHMQENT